MYSQNQIIDKFKAIHGNKYDYSQVNYTKMINHVTIICPEHGEFQQTPHSHLKGQGCPKCAIKARADKKRYTTESFIKKAKEIHNDYIYDKTNYIDSLSKVTVTCPKHGDFNIRPDMLLQGQGCPLCKNEKLSIINSDNYFSFVNKAKKVHDNKYDYSKSVYVNSRTKITITCPKHGDFQQTPSSHLMGKGCPMCANESTSIRQKKTTTEFIEKAELVHNYKYDYSKTEYKGIDVPVVISCPIHGDFKQKPSYHLSGNGCQKCGSMFSHYEDEIINFIKEYVGDSIIERDNRNILGNKQSIDIFIPEYNIGIEFDGLYWHNELNKPRDYHLNKTNICEKNGIHLIHIFEDEWIYKQDICKSRLKNLIHKNEKRVFARKCTIKRITSKEINNFCNTNHIQGSINSKINYGLFYDTELVSVMSFSPLRKNLGSTKKESVFEMLRFCNKLGYSVIGGASKLLNQFIKDYNPIEIVSYADRRWSQGDLYEKIGFELSNISKPSYFYVIGDKRKNRFSFRKDVLIKKYGCKDDETEHSFCLKNKWYRIYDCGCLCFKWKK